MLLYALISRRAPSRDPAGSILGSEKELAVMRETSHEVAFLEVALALPVLLVCELVGQKSLPASGSGHSRWSATEAE
jgi:hypothetical protein